jgi:hypothetical protein
MKKKVLIQEYKKGRLGSAFKLPFLFWRIDNYLNNNGNRFSILKIILKKSLDILLGLW